MSSQAKSSQAKSRAGSAAIRACATLLALGAAAPASANQGSPGRFVTPAKGFAYLTAADPAQLVAPAARKAQRPRRRPARMSPEEIREAEQRLSDLHYWTGRIDGAADEGLRHALIAFQKIEKRSRTGRLTAEELQALRVAARPSPAEAGAAHIEIDLKRQVLFVVDADGTASRILPVSTGTGKPFTSEGHTRNAITPCGRFRVQRKLTGWRKSPLGLLYYPMYLVGGVAIHGNPSVPVQPASHGCIRVPMFAAKELNAMTPLGTPVIVHDGRAAEKVPSGF